MGNSQRKDKKFGEPRYNPRPPKGPPNGKKIPKKKAVSKSSKKKKTNKGKKGKSVGNDATAGKQVPANAQQVVSLPTSQTKAAVNTEGITFTKGGSMALPNDTAGLNRDEALPSDVAQIQEFFKEQDLELEENFDNPFYMKVDRSYKVGNDVEYPKKMDANVSFMLRAKEGEDSFAGDTQVTFAYRSLQGQSDNRGFAPDKPNQDSVAVVRNKSTPHRAIFGVFDGHGPYGEHASHFCRMELLKMYQIALKQHPNDGPQEILGHTLRYLDRKFASTDHTAVPVDPIVSGTTAIVIMLDGDDIIAANVGDSRAILATRENENDVVIVPLSDDHKPERPDERRRIEASSAILMNENEVRNRKSGGKAPPQNPNAPPSKTYICRHTNGEIVYGVLFTRSIGDVDAHRNLGVSSDPEFKEAKIADDVDSANEQVIILGSDGVWDMMNNEEAATIALTTLDPHKACEEIVSKCSDRWATSGEGRRDDITVCVIGLGVKFGLYQSDQRGDRAGSYFGLI